MKRRSKTQAMRLLESRGVPYEEIVFPEEIHDALGAAAHTGFPPEVVYKTLVVLSGAPGARTALVLEPADVELDLKRAARAMGVRRLEMATRAEAERLTGLEVGGISALALTGKRWPVYLDRRAAALERIVVNAGRRGRNLHLRVEDFVAVTGAHWIDAARDAG